MISGRLAEKVVGAFGRTGATWLRQLPDIIAQCEKNWSLSVLPPMANLSYNYVAPALQADGREVILKIGVPNPELTTEIEALSLFNGRGSVKLLAVKRTLGAMLLERLKPGLPLASLTDDKAATRITAEVMKQLWRPVTSKHDFRTVGDWAAGLDRMRQRYNGSSGPLPEKLVAKAEGLFVELLSSMAQPVLLHGDLHQENILSAERRPWLAIDPKGILGEPAYEVGALLRNQLPSSIGFSQARRVTEQRVSILAEMLAFDRQRMLGWGLAQAVLAAWWCLEEGSDEWRQFVWYAKIIERPS